MLGCNTSGRTLTPTASSSSTSCWRPCSQRLYHLHQQQHGFSHHLVSPLACPRLLKCHQQQPSSQQHRPPQSTTQDPSTSSTVDGFSSEPSISGPRDLQNLINQVPFKRLSIWAALACFAYQLSDFIGVSAFIVQICFHTGMCACKEVVLWFPWSILLDE